MILIACSSQDVASSNAASAFISRAGLSEAEPGTYGDGDVRLRILDSALPKADTLDEAGAELIIFMSRHSSSAGVSAFTVHPTGNWGKEARLGGEPQTLSVAAPSPMLRMLRLFEKSQIRMESTYEATHHGPLLNTPSLFVEFGGNDTTRNDRSVAEELGRMVFDYVQSASEADGPARVVMGIGCTHYPRKFTDMALHKDYAFSHMMPKHAVFNGDGTDNIDVLGRAFERSSERVEKAVIDWKSIGSEVRSRIIKKLNDIGIDYERV
jgi:D-aminoacyl-tRNA deacylase